MYNKQKVISLWQKDKFCRRFPNHTTIAEHDIFIQHHSYDVSFPMININNSSMLNIFEEFILKMADLNITEVQKLEELICFKTDFIVFIQNKLSSYGLIDPKTFCITNNGKSYLGKMQQDAEEVTNVCGKVFVNLTNELSSYINIDEIYFDYNESDRKEKIKINVGSKGKVYTLNGDIIKSNTPINKPTSKNIKRNILKYNKTLSSLSIKKEFKSIEINNNFMIDISNSSETVYIHYKLVILDGNVDEVLVSDGFSICDEKLSKYVKEHHKDTVNKLKKSEFNNQIEQNRVTITNLKYHEVVKFLKTPMIVQDTTNLDEINKIKKDNNDLISDYYSAIEWAFYYHLKENLIQEDVMKLLKNLSNKKRKEEILEAANMMNISKIEENQYFFEIDRQDIQKFEDDNSPTMETVISLSIIEAKNNSNSNFYNVTQNYSFFLDFLSKLKVYRNKKSHGNIGYDKSLDNDKIKNMYDKSLKIVKLLLPNYTNNKSNAQDKIDASQSIINADVTLMIKLGEEMFNILENKNKDLLRQSIWFREKKQAMDYFNNIYKLFENYIKQINFELLNLLEEETILSKDLAVEKIISVRKKCPKCFSTVSLPNFNKAKQNKNVTLNSCGLLFFLLTEINDIDLVKIIDVIENIITKRAHGNNVNLLIDEEEFNELDKNIFEVIKILGGILYV